MNSLFNEVLANTSEEITPLSAVIAMALSLLLGGIIAFTYRKTQDEAVYQRSLAITLVMLPIILSVIILFIGSNIARAFSLAGTLSIIRFRSAPGDAKDIGFIFFDIAAGLACGVGMYAYGVLFVVILCLALIILEKANMFQVRTLQKTLKITIPENLNYSGAFEDILDTYTKSYTLTKIKTTDLGSLFELVYRVSMADGIDEQQFLNELRTRNGNLTIMLCESPQAVK
ncbi:MAG: DUF4956 domain-containing protein [Clostridia bacterium]|nr:DUF4956 domain-containing protein [Clostridia bacterium]MCI8979934.1 DUF4956 domain-containing protein [Clostridia bacterium]